MFDFGVNFCALSPAGAAILGSIFLKEKLGLTGILGTLLILLGMVSVNMINLFQKKKSGYEVRKNNSIIET